MRRSNAPTQWPHTVPAYPKGRRSALPRERKVVMLDILVFTPVYRLEPETVAAIFSLEWEGPISLLLQRDNPTGAPYLDHLHQYRRAQELFLAGPYEAMLVIENDIIPPPDALNRLTALECDVAYGCYQFRGGNVSNILQRYYDWPTQARNMGESIQIQPGLWAAAQKRGVIDCSGSGLGCTLIRRQVLEETPFEKSSSDGFFDWEWTQTVYRKGYRMRAEMNVLCGHKDIDGQVLWPPR